MTISLSDTGKRFNREWIFRHLSLQLDLGKTYAITGPNGSGKSTLLQVIAGAVAASEGSIQWSLNQKPLDAEQVYKHIAIAAPYLELIEEMTLLEFLSFHGSFKPFLPGISFMQMLERTGLQLAANKQIRFFSSGMKQRVKLIQAVYADCPVLLLDEPCTNLDVEGIQLYQQLMAEFSAGKLVIICSNDPQEYTRATDVFSIMQWKPAKP